MIIETLARTSNLRQIRLEKSIDVYNATTIDVSRWKRTRDTDGEPIRRRDREALLYKCDEWTFLRNYITGLVNLIRYFYILKQKL